MIRIEMLRSAIGVTNDSRDEWLGWELESALAFMERETRRYFREPTDFAEYLTPDRQGRLWLAQTPTSEDTVTVLGIARVGHDGDEVTGFEVRGRAVHLPSPWLYGTYAVGYQTGYALNDYEGGSDLPADVRKSILMLIKGAHDAQTVKAGVQSETIGGYSYSLFGDAGGTGTMPLPNFVARTIQNWKRGHAP